MRHPRTILITGASSGIGAALAAAYAEPGVHLALGARNQERLTAVAERCRTAGATVSATVIDVTDADAVAAWIAREDDDAGPLDLVIANAGIGNGLWEPPDATAALRRMIEVNLLGAVNTLCPALARMRRRRRGQIALMSSLAALHGLPGAHGYSASKAALRALAQGLRAPMKAEGVSINLVVPGFVRTPMNDHDRFPTPLRLEAEAAARLIKAGLARDRAVIAFPRTAYWAARLLALSPGLADAIGLRMLRRYGGIS